MEDAFVTFMTNSRLFQLMFITTTTRRSTFIWTTLFGGGQNYSKYDRSELDHRVSPQTVIHVYSWQCERQEFYCWWLFFPLHKFGLRFVKSLCVTDCPVRFQWNQCFLKARVDIYSLLSANKVVSIIWLFGRTSPNQCDQSVLALSLRFLISAFNLQYNGTTTVRKPKPKPQKQDPSCIKMSETQ